MASWTQQGVIEAPVKEVWGMLGDPSRFPEWSAETLDVTGVPTEIEKGSSFMVTSRGPLGIKATTRFEVEQLDELREIRLRCQSSGFYSRWLLTEAQGSTFAEVELGIEPFGLRSRALGAIHTKRYLRHAAEQALDGLQRALGGAPARK
jgi:uncharacterized protein YndB with AHSA1/START domain